MNKPLSSIFSSIAALAAVVSLALCAGRAAAQHTLPDMAPPPISPPLLQRPAHDPAPPPPPPPAPAAEALHEPEPPEEFVPPESGLEVTPGHYISGCVQLPFFEPRGPYSPAPPWPGGVIPFEYDGNVSQANRTLFNAAMSEVSAYCAVTFVPKQDFHLSWIHIQNSTANNAPIGFGNGQRVVNIVNWNVHYIMVHELFHVLGIYHEQSRTDRDNFVTINTSLISQTACNGPCNSNFNIENNSLTVGIYNFSSFMHYSRTAFTIGGDTITVQPAFAGIWQSRIGQRAHSTFGDRATAMRIYQPGWAKVARIGASPNGPGTWAFPYNNFPDAYNAAPSNGDVIIMPGYYTGLARWGRAMRLHAPDGGVRIGQ
ncbi:MAG: hypothetical protein KF864_05495 [Phycisphaeraceae bacterium]|nr:hypothetical protein [Phycisphaeraceae bacterium]